MNNDYYPGFKPNQTDAVTDAGTTDQQQPPASVYDNRHGRRIYWDPQHPNDFRNQAMLGDRMSHRSPSPDSGHAAQDPGSLQGSEKFEPDLAPDRFARLMKFLQDTPATELHSGAVQESQPTVGGPDGSHRDTGSDSSVGATSFDTQDGMRTVPFKFDPMSPAVQEAVATYAAAQRRQEGNDRRDGSVIPQDGEA